MRKSRKRRLLERQAKALHTALQQRHYEQPTEYTPTARVHSALHKPSVGYQGTYRAPKQLAEGSDAPAFYKAGARMTPQRPAKVAHKLPPHGRTNLK